jgi:YD repeat-containing protein
MVEREVQPERYFMTFAYDESGNLTRIVYPDGGITDYIYDDMERVKAIDGYLGSASKQGIWYDAASRVTKLCYENGVTTLKTYNSLGRLQAIQMPMIIGYTYDPVGNILSMGDQSFTYDYMNRLITASQPGQNYEVSYQYDKSGNRVSQIENQVTTQYTYDELNQLLYVTRGGHYIAYYDYDQRGNMSAKYTEDDWYYYYDWADRLISIVKYDPSIMDGVSVAYYEYAADGSRAAKYESGVTTHYLEINGKILCEVNITIDEENDNTVVIETTRNIYLGNTLVGQHTEKRYM